jgi:ABC-type transporter Mla subunit MlaD
MTANRNAFRAGIFIIASIVLIVAGVVGIAGSSNLFESWRTREVAFNLSDNLGGLRVGDDVRIGGVKVGQVKTIEIQTDKAPRILITFSLPEKYPLKEDARIGVESTVTGQSWLNIDNFGEGKPLADGVALVGHPSSISALLNSIGDTMPEIKHAVADVRTVTLPKVNTAIDTYKTTGEHATALVDHVNSKIDPAVEKYNAVADNGRDALANFRDLIGSKNGDFRGTLANLNIATGHLKEKLPGLLTKVDDIATKVSAALDSAKLALEDVKKTAANARDATANVRGILIGNRSKIDAMVTSLKTAGDNLKFLTAEVRRSPWRLLYRPNADEMANLNLYDSARQFAEGANSLSDAAEALRDSLKDPSANPEDIKKLTEKLDESFGKFQEVEADLYKRVQVDDKANLKPFIP